MRFLFTALIIWTVFGLHANFIFAQIPSSNPSKLIDYYEEKVDAYWVEQADSCVFYLQKVQEVYKEQKDWSNYIKSFNGMAVNSFYSFDYEQVKNYAQQAVHAVSKYAPQDSLELVGVANNLLSAYYSEKSDYKKGIEVAKKSLRQLLAVSSPDSVGLSDTYNNIGALYEHRGEYDQSIEYYQYALQYLPDSVQVNDKITVANLYNNIGFSYQNKRAYPESFSALKKALSLLLSIKREVAKPKLLTIYTSLGIHYQYLENYDSCLYYLQKSQELQTANHPYQHLTLKHFGTTYFYQKKYRKALNYLFKALPLRQKILGEKQVEVSVIYNAIGEIYQATNQPDSALFYHQKALHCVVQNFEETDFKKKPKLKNAISEIELLNTLKLKAKAFYKRYKNTHDLQDLEAAHSIYQLTDSLITKVRQGFLTEGSKYSLVEKSVPIYEEAIKTALILNKKEEAFYFAEKSKAVILLEAIKELDAKTFVNIPDSLQSKEQELAIEINYYKRKISEELLNKKKVDQDKIAGWKNKLFEYKQQVQNLKKILEKNFPKYYQIKQSIPTSNIAQLQRELDSNSAIIEFFVGKDTIYIFNIEQSKYTVQTILKNKNFDEQLNNLLSYFRKENHNIVDYKHFTRLAHQFYQDLLVPSISELSSNVNQLLIVPDGKLTYLPFEALLTKKPMSKEIDYRPSKLDYLIKTHAIGYAYSSTLWHKSLMPKNNPDQTNYNYIGFAPQFDIEKNTKVGCQNDTLQPLNPSKLIVKLCDIFDGQHFSNEKASHQAFISESPNARILHLYTHACVQDKAPMQNRIFFTDKPLYNYELYNLQLNADLAVLTACETGTGELLKGEGIMSLARGFLFAGCPSVVTSLWKAQENTTKAITQGFYSSLNEGYPKNQALQKAKLNFLEELAGKQTAHPYYWATFVHVGNHKPLFVTNTFGLNSLGNWAYLLLSFGLLLIIYHIFKFINSKQLR